MQRGSHRLASPGALASADTMAPAPNPTIQRAGKTNFQKTVERDDTILRGVAAII
jgi:hypothetical protein